MAVFRNTGSALSPNLVFQEGVWVLKLTGSSFFSLTSPIAGTVTGAAVGNYFCSTLSPSYFGLILFLVLFDSIVFCC